MTLTILHPNHEYHVSKVGEDGQTTIQPPRDVLTSSLLPKKCSSRFPNVDNAVYCLLNLELLPFL